MQRDAAGKYGEELREPIEEEAEAGFGTAF